MGAPFEIYPYSIDQLVDIFADKSISNKELIRSKIHLTYFNEYFEHLDTKTILVENDYIDRDFLEDFSSYYVRCFSDYRRKCTRLHFFKNEFYFNEFDALLSQSNPPLKESLQQNYLGFIVIKPLPLTIIGRTCLVTYPENNKKERNYPIKRKYEVNLFGFSLSIESLAFQEQDNVVAACATSTLWSVFHHTGTLFHHSILSPVEITKAATRQLPIETRTFPNKGLSGEQMAHAIENVNLEPFLVGVINSEYYLKSYIYAYLRFGIPLIFGIQLFEINEDNNSPIGRHAVAVVGYRIDNNYKQPEELNNEDDVQLVSSRISKLYVHDDQVGPFSRMVFDNQKIKVIENGSEEKLIALSTSWGAKNSRMGNVKAVPKILLVPLYHKIRIPFDTIHKTIRIFNSILDQLKENVSALQYDKFYWDIYLTDVNKLKSEIFNSEQYAEGYFKEILLKNMPRFIWRATALQGNKPYIDLLFDATDIEQGQYFICAIEYNKDFSFWLREIFKEDIFEKALKNTTVWKIIQWFGKT